MAHRIGVIGGDGIGPDVIAEGLKVIAATGVAVDTVDYDLGGARYLRDGVVLPDETIDEWRHLDALYLGAVGTPDVPPGVIERGLLLKMRFDLDLYVNHRPFLYPPSDIDFVVVRENTEGLYAGAGGNLKKGTPDEVAVQESINTRKGVERCLRYAFEYTRKRNKRKNLTLCGKTNVLTYAFDLWERAFHEIGDADYSDIKRDYAHVDAMTMWFVKNPEWFDVIVTDNMFGDIITDLGAMLQGGMGIAAGGNLNPEGTSMFEPIGGSAPKYTGQNVINPLAAICSGALMLETIGEDEAAKAIEDTVISVTREKIKDLGAGRMGYSTTEVGDLVASAL